MHSSTRPARLRRLLVAGVAAGTVAAALAAAPAVAKPIDGGTFHEEFSETQKDFCDVEGLTIEVDTVVDGRFLLNVRKPSTAPYFLNTSTITNTYRNAEGDFVTERVQLADKDLKITDHGDGTMTILVLSTGNAFVAGPDGKVLARNPGQIRFELLIDNAGTISDPSDDEFIEFLGVVKGSTGRTDDFCAAVLPILG
ncbi:hypothetical protein [Agromyces albus]|uniref:Uncharacterized protein n=1 Tax=Agromyces albus TaxID=205332 RepID=A0A4Q2L5W9_9MICO|nr:hypothetical protein [Agromyces albus]RXZ72967.1 hypothetical protein ESP51_01720 [Agromyces albus]